ncbi:hypothetical protein LX32DRAFT_651854 [Colletotrichum zoysiae]|uniref:Six-bladed beta-propeller-like protein n=1 Tax=Colletotrichum zoysiae TaxID=1216348 RepID=A0AAD9M670_9PEZI|nr:hypothetical protein LX32DRAFT_651854 [Colletotrichum zoysiae]
MLPYLPLLAALSGLSAAAALATTTLGAPHHLVHQFDNGFWAENIAVRSNGKLLITMIAPYPQVYQLDPLAPNPAPELITTFPNHLAALGIDEINPDVFAVVANNFTTSAGGSTPGSNTIYSLDMRTYDADGKVNVSVLAQIPDAVFLNGLTTIKGGDGGKFLTSDSFKGQIFEVDIKSGSSKVWLDDPILHFPAGSGQRTSDSVFWTKLDRHIVYVTTNGGVAGPVNGTITEPGKVVAIDTRRL